METGSRPSVKSEFRRLIPFMLNELKPKGRIFTPFNVISTLIMLVAAVILVVRFTKGLGAVTNLSQDYPWGIWIGFDVVTGVAFAGGAYVLTFMVYILRTEKYHPIIRATVLNGFLAYLFYAGALLLDLGRPWAVVNPIIGRHFGVSSVLFLVAWHFMLYMIAEFIEFSPAIAEWLGWRRIRKILGGLTLGAVIFGITLSTLHQSGLGALFLTAKTKIHPLWYSEFIPVLFFVSSIFAGLSLVIFESTVTHKVFHHKIGKLHASSHSGIILGLGRICAGAMFVYLFLQSLVFVHGEHWNLLGTGWGFWYLTELLGFVLFPGLLFFYAVRNRRLLMIRVAAVLALIGIIINRLNISVIAFQWDAPVRYYPTWMEIEVTMAIICAEIWAFRWVVNRMHVLNAPSDWKLGKAND